MSETLFPTGRVQATKRAGQALVGAGVAGLDLVARHVRGDWGDVGPEGREENERSLTQGGRIVSSYRLATGARLWIVTDAGRTRTSSSEGCARADRVASRSISPQSPNRVRSGSARSGASSANGTEAGGQSLT